MTQVDDIPETALAWHRAGKGAALATVVQTWGSAPRRVGSQLAISGEAEIAGSVSGGCVEGAVVAEALDAIEDGAPGDAGIRRQRRRCLRRRAGLRRHDPGSGGARGHGDARCDAGGSRAGARPARPVAYVTGMSRLHGALTTRAIPSVSGWIAQGFEEDGETFVAIHNPPLRLIVVGAVHIAQAAAADGADGGL